MIGGHRGDWNNRRWTNGGAAFDSGADEGNPGSENFALLQW
jgi:hypothetical protein